MSIVLRIEWTKEKEHNWKIIIIIVSVIVSSTRTFCQSNSDRLIQGIDFVWNVSIRFGSVELSWVLVRFDVCEMIHSLYQVNFESISNESLNVACNLSLFCSIRDMSGLFCFAYWSVISAISCVLLVHSERVYVTFVHVLCLCLAGKICFGFCSFPNGSLSNSSLWFLFFSFLSLFDRFIRSRKINMKSIIFTKHWLSRRSNTSYKSNDFTKQENILPMPILMQRPGIAQCRYESCWFSFFCGFSSLCLSVWLILCLFVLQFECLCCFAMSRNRKHYRMMR